MKFDHGVFAGGCCAESGTDNWEGKRVAEMIEQSSDKCPRRSVDMWHIDGHC